MAPSHELETIYRNRTRIVQTLFGPIRITRNYHYHTKARNGRYPLDDELELTGTYNTLGAALDLPCLGPEWLLSTSR